MGHSGRDADTVAGGLTVRRGDPLAGFAEQSVMEFSGDHSAQRHMHLKSGAAPFAILPRRGRNPDSLLFQNAPSRFDSHVKGRRTK